MKFRPPTRGALSKEHLRGPASPPRARGTLASALWVLTGAAAWAACADTRIAGADDDTSAGGRGGGQPGAGAAAGPEGGEGQGAGGGPGGSTGGSAGTAGGATGGSGGGAGGSPPVGEGGLPCDVQSFLNAKCTSCHSDPPRNDAPMPLTSYGALAATNAAGVRFADRALARVQAGTMPPGDALSAADYAAFEAWVEAGAPEGSCEPVDDPFDDPPACSSGQSVPFCSGDDDDEDDDDALDDDCEGPTMNPGLACGAGNCHGSGGEGPRLWFGGTVYRGGHEPDGCVGGPAAGTAQVVITDAAGLTVSREVNAAGNFFLFRSQLASLTFPIRAEVRHDGRVRAMATPQMTGDCNGCHTQGGQNGAPGRIALP